MTPIPAGRFDNGIIDERMGQEDGGGQKRREGIKCESHGVETERNNEGSEQNWFPREKVN